MNLKNFSQLLSHRSLASTAFVNVTSLLIDPNENTSLKALRVWIQHRVMTTQQDADERMKLSQRRYYADYEGKLCNEPLPFTAGLYVSFDWLLLTTSAAEWLANESYSKLMPWKLSPFKIFEVTSSTLAIDEDGIRNTVWINHAILAP